MIKSINKSILRKHTYIQEKLGCYILTPTEMLNSNIMRNCSECFFYYMFLKLPKDQAKKFFNVKIDPRSFWKKPRYCFQKEAIYEGYFVLLSNLVPLSLRKRDALNMQVQTLRRLGVLKKKIITSPAILNIIVIQTMIICI